MPRCRRAFQRNRRETGAASNTAMTSTHPRRSALARIPDRSWRDRHVHGVGRGVRGAALLPVVAGLRHGDPHELAPPRPDGAGDGPDGDGDHLLAVGPAVGRAHEPGGDADVLRLGKVARPMPSATSSRSSPAASSASRWRPLLSRRRLGSVGQLRRDVPGPAGDAVAFVAEAAISFVLMLTVLTVSNHRRAGAASRASAPACWSGLYITVEAPLSGMSMNPARTLRSALLGARLSRPLDLLRGSAARHAGRRRAVHSRLRRARGACCCAKLHHPLARHRASSAAASKPDARPLETSKRHDALRRDHHRHRRGRRHAGLPARPVRQADPAARARRLRPPREGQLELARGQRRRRSTTPKRCGRTRTASRSTRTRTTTSAATPSSTARRCSACARRTSARFAHHGGVSPAWPISYDELEPYYTQAEQLYQVHGERGVDPTEPLGERAVPVSRPCSTSRASSSCTTTCRPAGCGRSTCRSASCWTSRTRTKSRCIRCETCDGFPCLVHAKSDAQVICVDPALEHPNVTLLTNAKVDAAA